MSASLKLTSDELRNLADALAAMTEMTRHTGVRIGIHSRVEVAVSGTDTVIQVRWESEQERYVIDDQIGD